MRTGVQEQYLLFNQAEADTIMFSIHHTLAAVYMQESNSLEVVLRESKMMSYLTQKTQTIMLLQLTNPTCTLKGWESSAGMSSLTAGC